MKPWALLAWVALFLLSAGASANCTLCTRFELIVAKVGNLFAPLGFTISSRCIKCITTPTITAIPHNGTTETISASPPLPAPPTELDFDLRNRPDAVYLVEGSCAPYIEWPTTTDVARGNVVEMVPSQNSTYIPKVDLVTGNLWGHVFPMKRAHKNTTTTNSKGLGHGHMPSTYVFRKWILPPWTILREFFSNQENWILWIAVRDQQVHPQYMEWTIAFVGKMVKEWNHHDRYLSKTQYRAEKRFRRYQKKLARDRKRSELKSGAHQRAIEFTWKKFFQFILLAPQIGLLYGFWKVGTWTLQRGQTIWRSMVQRLRQEIRKIRQHCQKSQANHVYQHLELQMLILRSYLNQGVQYAFSCSVTIVGNAEMVAACSKEVAQYFGSAILTLGAGIWSIVLIISYFTVIPMLEALIPWTIGTTMKIADILFICLRSIYIVMTTDADILYRRMLSHESYLHERAGNKGRRQTKDHKPQNEEQVPEKVEEPEPFYQFRKAQQAPRDYIPLDLPVCGVSGAPKHSFDRVFVKGEGFLPAHVQEELRLELEKETLEIEEQKNKLKIEEQMRELEKEEVRTEVDKIEDEERNEEVQHSPEIEAKSLVQQKLDTGEPKNRLRHLDYDTIRAHVKLDRPRVKTGFHSYNFSYPSKTRVNIRKPGPHTHRLPAQSAPYTCYTPKIPGRQPSAPNAGKILALNAFLDASARLSKAPLQPATQTPPIISHLAAPNIIDSVSLPPKEPSPQAEVQLPLAPPSTSVPKNVELAPSLKLSPFPLIVAASVALPTPNDAVSGFTSPKKPSPQSTTPPPTLPTSTSAPKGKELAPSPALSPFPSREASPTILPVKAPQPEAIPPLLLPGFLQPLTEQGHSAALFNQKPLPSFESLSNLFNPSTDIYAARRSPSRSPTRSKHRARNSWKGTFTNESSSAAQLPWSIPLATNAPFTTVPQSSNSTGNTGTTQLHDAGTLPSLQVDDELGDWGIM